MSTFGDFMIDQTVGKDEEIRQLRARLHEVEAERDELLCLRKTPPVPLLQKIVEVCDLGSAKELGDAQERLRAVRNLIIGEAV